MRMALGPISLRGVETFLCPAKTKALDGVQLADRFSQSEGFGASVKVMMLRGG
jgi:hypothetical protein